MNCSFQGLGFAVTKEENAFEPAKRAGAWEFEGLFQCTQLNWQSNELSSLQQEQ